MKFTHKIIGDYDEKLELSYHIFNIGEKVKKIGKDLYVDKKGRKQRVLDKDVKRLDQKIRRIT